MVSVLLSAQVERVGVSRMRFFFLLYTTVYSRKVIQHINLKVLQIQPQPNILHNVAALDPNQASLRLTFIPNLCVKRTPPTRILSPVIFNPAMWLSSHSFPTFLELLPAIGEQQSIEMQFCQFSINPEICGHYGKFS